MRDISFLEWFLLGMPVEWFLFTVVAGAAFLIWAAATTRLDRRRRERRGGRDGRGPPRDR
jgi:membrane protein implicated in regulation of membrane protease activity